MKPESKWMDAEAAEGEGPPQRVFKKEAAEAVALHMKLQRVVSRSYPPPLGGSFAFRLSPPPLPDVTQSWGTQQKPVI